MMIQNATPFDETPFGSFGNFDAYEQTASWTDEDWAEYDRLVGEEISEWEAQTEPYDEFYADDSIEPPF